MKFGVSPCGSKSHDGVSLLFPISLAFKTAEKLLTVLFRSSMFTSSHYKFINSIHSLPTTMWLGNNHICTCCPSFRSEVSLRFTPNANLGINKNS